MQQLLAQSAADVHCSRQPACSGLVDATHTSPEQQIVVFGSHGLPTLVQAPPTPPAGAPEAPPAPGRPPEMKAPPTLVPPFEDMPPPEEPPLADVPEVPWVPADDVPPDVVELPPWLDPEAPEAPEDPEAPAELVPALPLVLPSGVEPEPPLPDALPSPSELQAAAVATSIAVVTRQNIPCTSGWGLAVRLITTPPARRERIEARSQASVLQRLERSNQPVIQRAEPWRIRHVPA